MFMRPHCRGKEERHLPCFSQKGHLDDQVAFHSYLNAILNLPHAGTEWVSVASVSREISKSNRLLISPHLFSVTVGNWLSRGGLRQHRSVTIRKRRRSHPLLEEALPEFSPLILARLWRAHQYFTSIFMCVIQKMLFQLWSVSANCLTSSMVPALAGWGAWNTGVLPKECSCFACYFNLLLAFCINPQKHCHWQLISCKFMSCLLGFSLFEQ